MSRSRFHLGCALLAAAFLVFAGWMMADWGGPRAVLVASDVGSVLAGATAAICAAVAARRCRGRHRLAWGALTVALAAWLFGDTIWAYYELVVGVDRAPFPSPADAGYLFFPVAACLALILLPIGTVGQSQPRLLLDGSMVGVSLFVIFWAIGLEDVFERGDDTLFAFAVSVAYPIMDLMLLTVALVMLTRARSGQRALVTVFAMAMGVMALSDGAFVLANARDDYTSGGLIDVGWVGGLLLLGVAAMLGTRSSHIEYGLARVPSGVEFWLPYVPLPFATLCIVVSEGSVTLAIASMLLVCCVVARQFLVAAENRRLLGTVADQALRDPLTKLANRALFQDRLAHAVALQLRDGRTVAVLSIDLDDFKLVNDSLGHPAGDSLLSAVAERIVACVRSGDTVARIGGDEFAVLLEDGPDPALVVAHRIFDAFDGPFTIDGHDVFMRPSVGVASGSAGGDATSASSLLKQADQAMYAAKRSQHGGVATFTSDMQLIDQREVDPPTDRDLPARRSGSAGLQLFAQLRRAIDRGELSLAYQPKFTVATGRVAGVEALVRWEHPERGLLMPAEFLPLARQNGLMGALTEAVITQAVRDAAGWHSEGFDVPFAVNLFPPSLSDLDLPARIAHLVADGGMHTGALTVEITEDFLLGNTRRARRVIEMLREFEIRVSIDDFGSGYSALSYLRELPVDEIKLDREFIAPMISDDRADAIVSAMIDLAHRLGMTCVAEGVEDAATQARLAEHGCDVLQGFHCSPPVAASRVLDVPPLPPRTAPSGVAWTTDA